MSNMKGGFAGEILLANDFLTNCKDLTNETLSLFPLSSMEG
jgi:hypothetical protein